MEPETPDTPDPIAAFDQALRGMTEWAKMMRAHYEAMVAVGFTFEQAFALTLAYQGGWQAQGVHRA